ncbi:SAM-dependent methyltransferase [Nocardioides aromaticivorans]|uniref:SAM-dependent methyltransferase n=1 Tax=Nocardioides aromaticivorans TaxID=200618 RepID=A0ABX7PKC1_9ACTN|nr:class I SAM-dependent methyltransferase [Nocardioides aromaticivorans]QSR26232.1 SAM-dependent methyltransferase [Nocardioides aromaticivorans]
MSTLLTEEVAAEAGALTERIFEQVLASMEIATVWLGHRLGLYDALVEPATSAEVAARTGVIERYVREWLEQQAIAGLVAVDDASAPPDQRRFGLSPAQRLALADAESPFYAGALALLGGGCGAALPQVLDAWRHGTGLSFGAYGDDVRDGQGLFNKADFEQRLVQEWLPAVPDVDALLRRTGARALDLGCGVGWSSIALARGYAGLTVDGVDLDEASVMDARANALVAGVGDRARFEVVPSDADHGEGRYDVALFLESLHDMAHPVPALRAVRRALRPGGRVFVMDEGAADEFAPDGSPVERLLGAASVLHCLPVGLAEADSAGTGALFRPSTLREYAAAAGYSAVRDAPIEHDFMRFYVLEA